MIDHIVLKNLQILEVQAKTSEEALLISQSLENLKKKENFLARKNNGLPTDFNISTHGSQVIISGSVFFALAIFKKYNVLSEERRHILCTELNKLRQNAKIAHQLALPGTTARRQITSDERKKREAAYQKISAKTQKIIDQHNREDSEDEHQKTDGLLSYKSHL